MATASGDIATFRRCVPDKPDDPVMEIISIDNHRAVGLRINAEGAALLSFFKKCNPAEDLLEGKLVPCATVRFNDEEDQDHMVTEVCVSPEALHALKKLFDKYVN